MERQDRCPVMIILKHEGQNAVLVQTTSILVMCQKSGNQYGRDL